MGKKILLVTAQPLSTTDAENLVKDFGAADTEFVIAVPAKVVDTGSPSLLSGNTANPGTDGTQIGTVRDNLPAPPPPCSLPVPARTATRCPSTIWPLISATRRSPTTSTRSSSWWACPAWDGSSAPTSPAGSSAI